MADSAAREFGRALKTIRRVRGWTGEEASRRAEISRAYLIQIEAGTKDNPSSDVLSRLHRAYGIPENLMADLLLRLRVLAALEDRGLVDEHRAFVWRGVSQRLDELNLGIHTEPNDIISEVVRTVSPTFGEA